MRLRTHPSLFFMLAIILFGGLAAGPSLAGDDANSERAIKLIRQVEDMYRSSSSYAEMSMTIVTPHWERTMLMEAWSRGTEDSFIRILSPKKDAGITTLKIKDEMWNFFPKINKTIKVPPSMMMGSWMGSDFTNDDLVKESRMTEDYHLSMSEDEKIYSIELTPKEETATVWARIVIVIEKDTLHPVTQTYFDDNGEKVRILEYSDLRDFNGRVLPATMTMTPLTKENHKTTVSYEKLELGIPVDDSLFTLRNLKKRRH